MNDHRTGQTPAEAADVAPGASRRPIVDNLVHATCCDRTRGICGADMQVLDPAAAEDDADLCVVCESLAHYPCERCPL